MLKSALFFANGSFFFHILNWQSSFFIKHNENTKFLKENKLLINQIIHKCKMNWRFDMIKVPFGRFHVVALSNVGRQPS